jgi:hypothetical protein
MRKLHRQTQQVDKPYLRSHSGQALTEFLTLAFALIPLFLLIPVIAKYQDISHATQMASRYAAFDAMTRNDTQGSWKPEAQLADEVRRRFFSNGDASIKADDTAGNFKADQNQFWVDPNGAPLIKDFATDVSISFGTNPHATHDASDFTAGEDGKYFPIRAQLGLQAKGAYRANVRVVLANLPAIGGVTKSYEKFETIDLAMTRSTSLLIDPWASQSVAQAEQRFGGNPAIFPAGRLSQYNAVTGAAVAIVDVGFVAAPRLGQLDFWRDVVPEDRLR